MVVGDASYIKKINRGLIISNIIKNDGISRANLSKVTGLNKATITVQVADLLDDKLIVESQQEHNNLGRRPIMLTLNRKAGYALGIDLDNNQMILTLSDLLGYPVHTETIRLQTKDYDEIVAILLEHIHRMKHKCSRSRYGIIGIVIGIHGIVSNDEMIHFVPKLQWRNRNLKADIEKETSLRVYIENNANLCAFAEKVYKHNESDNLLSITMHSGIGLGVLVNGHMMKGHHGYAGEIGHMIVVPDGERCSCGNHGCWELYASETSFYENVSEHDLIKQMEQFIKYVAIGLNNVINLYNPETLILHSELLRQYPDAIEKIKQHLTSTISHYRELLLSDLGKEACVMGACAFAIRNFLEVSDLSLEVTERKMAESGEYYFS